VVAPPGQAAEQRGRAQREDVAAAQPAPDRGQFLRGGCGGGPGGEERGVQGVGRGADEQVRRDAALVQGMDHPGLHGAQGGAAGQHERVRGAHAARPAAGPAMLVLVLIRVSSDRPGPGGRRLPGRGGYARARVRAVGGGGAGRRR
jgi:hypothetical protein